MFVLLLGFILHRTHKIKTKRKLNIMDYCSVILFSLFVVASLFWVLGHFILGIFILFIAMVYGIVIIPFSKENAKFAMEEAIKNVDATKPLQIKDLFSWNFIPKLEKKYGEHKTLAIFITTYLCLAGVVTYVTYFLIEHLILINDPWYRGIPWPIMVGPIIGSLIGALISYRNAKKVLKAKVQSPSALERNQISKG